MHRRHAITIHGRGPTRSAPDAPARSRHPMFLGQSARAFRPAGIFPLWLALVLAAMGAAGAAVDDHRDKITPPLARRLGDASPDAAVGFIVVCAQQADPVRLRIEAEQIAATEGRDAGRAYARGVLQQIASDSQGPLVAYLDQEVQAGRVQEYHSLWIANAVVGRATAAVIEALAAYESVDRIIWNPPVEPDQQIDEVVPAHGLRSKPARMGLPRDEREIAWHVQAVGAPDVWGMGIDGSGVTVAIIDTGVDYTHPDLAGHIWENVDEVPWNHIDDDFNGFVDDTLGWNFVFDNNDPMGTGSTDHGTRAAGIVAGDGTSGTITGVAPAALIMPLRATGGDWGDVFAAIQYACDNGADVISMSSTQKWHFEPKPDYAFWRQVTDNELALGMLHANSIGNVGDELFLDPIPFNIGVPGSCPAAWVHPDQYLSGGVSATLGAGSVDSSVVLSDFSSRGPFAWEDIAAVWPEYPHPMPAEYLDYAYSTGEGGLIKPDLVAPGEDVLSTRMGGGYLTFTGTSASCPHLAGAMALMLQARPDITAGEVAMALQLTAVDLGPVGKDNDYAAGFLRADEAVWMALDLSTLSTVSGVVTDAVTGDSLAGVAVTALTAGVCDTTNAGGGYAIYGLRAGLRSIEARAFGYLPDTLIASTMPGMTTPLDVQLVPGPAAELSGTVTDAGSGLPITGARLELLATPLAAQLTDQDGFFRFASVPVDTQLVLRAVHFSHQWIDTTVVVSDSSAGIVDLALEYGVADDFEVDQGWQIGDPGDTALHGWWVRCDPNGVYDGSVVVQPEDDATPDPGRICFVTGNGVPGAGEHQNDVDGGRTTLTSPCFDATWYWQPVVSFYWWYSNDTSYFVDDTLRVEISNDAGRTWVPLIVTTTSNHAWTQLSVAIEEVTTLSDSMRVRFIAADTGEDSAVEVGVDDFAILGQAYAGLDDETPVPGETRFLGAQPNPFRPGGMLAFTLAREGRAQLEIYDPSGRCVRVLSTAELDAGPHRLAWDGADASGRLCARGVYFARLRTPGAAASGRIIVTR